MQRFAPNSDAISTSTASNEVEINYSTDPSEEIPPSNNTEAGSVKGPQE